jgi:hypothetical protein
MSLGRFDGISASNIGKLASLSSANVGKVGGAGSFPALVGTAWSTTSSMNVARGVIGGCGDINGSLSIGGAPGGTYLATTEKWSGSSWSTTGTLTLARNHTKDRKSVV